MASREVVSPILVISSVRPIEALENTVPGVLKAPSSLRIDSGMAVGASATEVGVAVVSVVVFTVLFAAFFVENLRYV